MRQLREAEKAVRRVMIAGGGNIGLRLARQLADENYSVRIIEHDLKRCEYLATQLPDNVLVLHGSGTDEDLLERENIEDMDTWLALTSDDEDNIMSSLLAKRLGARKVIALINRQAYGELMQGSHIDIAVSPSQATMSELLRHVRRGDVAAVHRCVRAWPRRWRPSPTATAPIPRWWEDLWARSACPGRQHRRAGARRRDHPARRGHRDRDRRPRDRVRAVAQADAARGKAVPGFRLFLLART